MPFFLACLQCNWREGLSNLTDRGSGSVPFAWREGLSNLTDRGSGSVPFAWREGLAGHSVQVARGKALSVDRSWCGEAS